MSWPGTGVIKVGVSYRQRWLRFALRGATVHELREFPDSTSCYNAESVCHKHLFNTFPRAFPVSTDSIPFLGDTGGYLECYQVGVDGVDAAVAACSSMLASNAQACV